MMSHNSLFPEKMFVIFCMLYSHYNQTEWNRWYLFRWIFRKYDEAFRIIIFKGIFEPPQLIKKSCLPYLGIVKWHRNRRIRIFQGGISWKSKFFPLIYVKVWTFWTGRSFLFFPFSADQSKENLLRRCVIFTKRVSFELFDCTYTELIKTNKTRFHPYKYENLKVIRKRQVGAKLRWLRGFANAFLSMSNDR